MTHLASFAAKTSLKIPTFLTEKPKCVAFVLRFIEELKYIPYCNVSAINKFERRPKFLVQKWLRLRARLFFHPFGYKYI